MKNYFSLSIFLLILVIPFTPDSFSACIFDEETGKYLEPCQGLPVPQTPSLKEQVQNDVDLFDIRCPNPDHVLTQRPSSKLACVTENTADKLDWQIIYQ